jgi:hypothetical protein
MNSLKSFIIGLVLLNATFDLFSALFKEFNLHSLTFDNDNDNNNDNNDDNRFLRYYVITNGIIRFFIIFNNIYVNYIIIITYIIEIAIFNYEYFFYNNSIKFLYLLFISLSSLLLIFLIMLI